MRLTQLLWLASTLLLGNTAQAYDERWPDYNVVATDRGNTGAATYFQGFESPCFGPPYQPGTGELDWIRYYSEVVRVPSGSSGIPSRNGLNHAEVRPPLAGAPGPNVGAYTRLGGFRTQFGGGFTVELDVYFDLSDPRVSSGINADYGWDATTGINTQTGVHRRDFIFFTASNTSGQILVGSGNVTNFAPQTNLAAGSHYVVTSSGWRTLQWVFRDAGDGTLAVDTNLRSSAGALLWTRTLNNPSDVIASQIGGNRYLWFPYMRSDRLAMDNARLNSVVREALYASAPSAGSTLDAGSANVGSAAPGTALNLQSQGSLRLEVCSCAISGPAAADFSVATCPALIEPGANLNLAIGCTPSAAGARTANLTIVTNDITRGTNFSYPLQCNGIAAPVGTVGVPVPASNPWTLLLLALALGTLGMALIRTRSM